MDGGGRVRSFGSHSFSGTASPTSELEAEEEADEVSRAIQSTLLTEDLLVDWGEEDGPGGRLSWREPAESSMSDHAIAVRSEECGELEAQLYHVHRAVIGVGPRCSSFFRTLLTSSLGGSEQREASTELTLPKKCAQAFPAFLDYLYGIEANGPAMRVLENTGGTQRYLVHKDLSCEFLA